MAWYTALGRRARVASRLRAGHLAVLLSLFAFLGATWVSTFVFDRLPHVEDEVAFLFQAKTIASGQLTAPAPPLPEFFEIPFVLVREGRWFGKYPPGYPLVLAAGVAAGQPWLVNPVAGALCVSLVYLLGRRLYGSATALLAAALLVASPFFLLQAGSFMTHVVSLLWATLFVLLFAASRQRRAWGLALAAGASLGMLFLTRPLTAVGIGAPFALWVAAQTLLAKRSARLQLPLLLGFVPFVACFLAYNALTTGSPLKAAYELWWPYDRIGFGQGVGVLGHYGPDEAIINVRYSLRNLANYLFGWLLGLSLVPAVLAAGVAVTRLAVATWRCRTPGNDPPGVAASAPARLPADAAYDVLLFAVAVSLVVVHLAYWISDQTYGPRYYFEAIGALVLLSARGILCLAGAVRHAARRLAPAASGRPERYAALAVWMLVLGLFLNAYADFVPREFTRYIRWYDIDASGLHVVDEAGLHQALVFVAYGYWTDYAPFFTRNTPALDGDVVYAIDRGPAQNRRLMALYPGRAFYRYADRRLVPLTAEP